MAHDTSKIENLVSELAGLIAAKNQKPFILCGIYSGGTVLGKMLRKRLQKLGIETKLFSIKIKKGDDRTKYTVIQTDLPQKNSPPLVIFLDDAVWTGRTISTVDRYMRKHHSNSRWQFATLLDCRGDADYALF